MSEQTTETRRVSDNLNSLVMQSNLELSHNRKKARHNAKAKIKDIVPYDNSAFLKLNDAVCSILSA